MEIVEMDKQKETNHPLSKLTDLLDKWSREEIHTADELIKFAHELWVTTGEFEKDLKESMKGHEMVMIMKEHKYQTHIDWIKNKLGFQADALEITLNELKLR